MTGNADLITSFYEAFERRDHEAMNACYDPSIRFSDPVFRNLEGNQVKAMWHMFCDSRDGFEVTFSGVDADDRRGSAHWEASYKLRGRDRQIHNVIEAEFDLREGLIYRHRDSFDLWKWTRMALGTPGVLLGWSGLVQNKVRETAMHQLNKFMAEHAEYS